MFKLVDIKVMLTSFLGISSIGLLQRISELEPIISFTGQIIIWIMSVIYLTRKILNQKK